MNIGRFIHDLFSDEKDSRRFQMVADSDGLNFFVPTKEDFEKCKNNEMGGLLMHQYVCLRMLEEQGYAEQIANGYIIPSVYAVAIEDETKLLLDFPPPYSGTFSIRVEGQTTQSAFSIQIIPILPDGTELFSYQLKGPCIRLSSQEIYLLSPAEWTAFQALKTHREIPLEKRSERLNLKLVGSLQAARKLGMSIDLSHFNTIKVHEPEKIGVAVTQQEDGGLLLTPTFGSGITPESIERRLGQLPDSKNDNSNDIGVIRVHDRIVVLDDTRLKATHEILSNRKIPPSQVKRFLESPTAFLDASLVDLDAGFSFRVRGATIFRHAYFGETDESGLSWFEQALKQTELVYPPSELHKVIETAEDLHLAQKRIDDARDTGATVVDVSGKTIDIADEKAVSNILTSIEKKISGSADTQSPGRDRDGTGPDKPPKAVVDIRKNDEELEYGSDYIPALIREAAYKAPIDYSIYKREPYPHQDEGIRWILGLAEPTLSLDDGNKSLHGALLADDMGLGKTYMALVAVAEYYRQCREKNIVERPTLIVVPLTLLENWKQEIEQTFYESPFSDIQVLQADADLNRFRIKGTGVEIRQQSESVIRYSLRVGKKFGIDRLDLPRRLVLTTYQTLRDYQFSLCRVDWSFVIFDEAQNIKNPNTLATRAAKGLKARFKLLATGTPVENHLGDFWCLMDTASPGALGAYQKFRQEFITPIRRAAPEQISQVRQSIGKRLRNKVGNLMLRRLKEDNLEGLPKKRIYSGINMSSGSNCHYAPFLEKEMRGEQLYRYDTTIDTVLEMQQQGAGGNPVLTGLHQLREISLHPLLLNRGMLTTPKNAKEARELFHLSGKLEILLNILDQIKEREEKAIIFLINKRLQSFLKISLGLIYDTTVEVINGETKAIAKSTRSADRTRKGIIDAFEAGKGFGAIIMSPVAAGTGLTVVAANHVIHLERHWNPAKEEQATDRVFRIGQEKDVNVYLPILKHPLVDSFDVNLHTLLSNKVTLKDAVVTPEEVSNDEMGRANFRSSVNQKDQERPLRGGDLSLLSWQEFEALCAELYGQKLSGDAFLTPTNDRGADVVVLGGQNVLIQCKHTHSRKYDSLEPLIQIHGAKPAYEEKTGKTFSTLVVAVSASKFTRKVLTAAQTYGVTLLGTKDLDNLLQRYSVTRKDIQRRLLASRIFEG